MEESNSSKTLPQNPKPPTPAPSSSSYNRRDFLSHLEAYLAKRDGVDKLLKISRYASKIILASSLLSQSHPLHPRLKSFESSVGVSRKAFRLGKFVQDLNALRSTRLDYRSRSLLSVVAYGGEGLYFFVEQFVWLSKTGFIDARRSPSIQKISAWAELIGYFGSISLKAIDLREILDEEERLLRSAGADGCDEEAEKLRRRLREKGLLKKLSIVQDIADGLMAAADVRDGKGWLSGPLLLASAGLLSALISTHKNWISC